MKLSPLLRPVGIAAVVIGLIQSLTYTVLTLLGVLLIHEAWIPDLDYSLSGAIYLIYFTKYFDGSSLIVVGKAFNAFVWTYFVLSFVWLVLCQCFLWVLVRRKYEQVKLSMFLWCLWTTIISTLDIVLMCLLAADYDYISHNSSSEMYQMVVAVGVMMTIAAKGFGLLLANMVFVAILYRIVIKMDTSDSTPIIRDDPYISAYGGQPWASSNGLHQRFETPTSSPAYDDRSQRPEYDRTSSQNNYGMPPAFNQPKLAKPPGNHGGRSPRGPFIPAPDYSPPASPLQKYPRSVLKSRSQY